MTHDLLAIRAIDLGCVRTSQGSWRSLGFDLTAISGDVRSGAFWISDGRHSGERLCLAEAGDRKPILIATLPASAADAAVRVPLDDGALTTLERASGGVLVLDAWISRGESCDINARAIVLELDVIQRPAQRAA